MGVVTFCVSTILYNYQAISGYCPVCNNVPGLFVPIDFSEV